MLNRISSCIRRAGLEEVPSDPGASLADHGFDSLLVVLTVTELEKEFAMKIPAAKIKEDTFESLQSIADFLKTLGAKP